MYFTRSIKRRSSKGICLFQGIWRNRRHLLLEKDPITLDNFEHPIFKHVDEAGNTSYFTATILAEYIMNTGDYRNPLTRVDLNDVEIRRLARLSGRMEILDTAAREQERKRTLERDSLREFFFGELDSIMETAHELSRTTFTIPYMLRNFITGVFPQLVILCIRIMRADGEFLGEFSGRLFSDIDRLKIRSVTAGNIRFMSAVVVLENFCCTVVDRAREGNLVDMESQTAIVQAAGLTLTVDATQI